MLFIPLDGSMCSENEGCSDSFVFGSTKLQLVSSCQGQQGENCLMQISYDSKINRIIKGRTIVGLVYASNKSLQFWFKLSCHLIDWPMPICTLEMRDYQNHIQICVDAAADPLSSCHV